MDLLCEGLACEMGSAKIWHGGNAACLRMGYLRASWSVGRTTVDVGAMCGGSSYTTHPAKRRGSGIWSCCFAFSKQLLCRPMVGGLVQIAMTVEHFRIICLSLIA